MQCLGCGCQNKATNEYCEGCGATLGIECSACGHFNGPTARFCGRCSVVLKPTSTQISNQSWQQVLKSLQAKGGERKHVTILFADIRNSTGLMDSLGDPELGMKRLQPILDLMNEAVVRYDGIVNKSQGDGVMALFGAPQPHEDHAVRGCLSALAMQDGMTRIGDRDLQIRVGVHTGEVVVQAIEHGMYQTYDAAGANVHLASRMEHLAEAGSILISRETYVAAKQFVEVEPLGPQSVRGIAAPVEVFSLKGLQHAPSSGVFRSGIRLSPLTGRSEQNSALLSELEHTKNGDGRVVGVVGEAGIGKSRLCFEFAESCRGKDIRVFEARVLAHGKATPFQPVLELLRDYFGLRTKELADVLRDRVRDRLAALSVSEQFSLILLEFLGLGNPQHPAPKLDPKARKTQLLDFVRTLPRSGSSVVIIEDLHWIDSASEEFVEALADAVVGTKTLLVLNFRPGFVAPLMQRSHYRQISMPSLGPAEATSLLQDRLGNDTSLALLTRNIVARAQGNPFFIEELVNALVERGDFEGEEGAYRLKGGIDAIPLPSTVQAVIAARIDRLEEDAKQVLEVASVIGREISISVLESVCGLDQSGLSQAVQRLRRSELLYDVPPFEQRLVAFRHPLIQEVAYRSLLQDRRRELHSKVAQAIETLFKDRADERASLLAYHLEQAGENLKAAQQNMRAAVWIGTNDPSQALRSWKKVRELLSDLPSSQPIDYLRMMASGQIVNFAWREGIPAQDALIYFEEAKQLALALSDIRANALIHAAYGRMIANGGSADEYVEKIREAKAIADKGNDPSVQITLKAVLCHALRLSGRMLEALQMNTEAMDRANEIVKFDRQTLGFDVDIWLTVMRGQTLVMLGRTEEACPLLDRIIQLESSQVDAINYGIPSWAYVDLAWAEGNIGLAQEHADRAFSIAVNAGNPYLRVYAQACRGVSHIVAGRLTSAVEDLSDALSFARSRKAGLENEPRILADLANAYRLNGDTATALTTVDEAIKVATERHARVPECLARIIRAKLLLRSAKSDEKAEGEQELDRARALTRETGAVLFEAFLNDTSVQQSGLLQTSTKVS
ncbi:AAA family ATPase [Bradyrhizobium sp. AUGA SZCCT0222]|uniref:adenylate/guanylate cyclase domain-containing protein n=1 Tax=Bradyrhizobium sp. AUGA SZCCT0222 TaxID=2807668 RepID=UPI001BA50E88|nr:adenylate/guanylate cyclase domain-containing protein [Bradyrhizobium sp. AUGA SZCCT0222]MBR1267728.1 AAA family ATPase [Bradyrhizobium sp. AUGA SZCCT0222]